MNARIPSAGIRQRCSPLAITCSKSSGVTLIDVLVGLVVMSVTVLVVFQTFIAIQSFGRNEGESADALSGGMFALSIMAIQAANAGAGLSASAHWFETCPPDASIASTFRPIAVLITDGGSVDRPDSLVIRQSFASTSVAVSFAAPADPGSILSIQSIGGFSAGDRVVAISRTGVCVATALTAVASIEPGVLNLAHTGLAVSLPASSVLVNLGPSQKASTARYDVSSGALRSTDIGNGDSPNPLVSNIVNLKFQYGIDNDGDGSLDTWVSAVGPWSASTLLIAPKTVLDKIVAVRIGVLVRTERIDRALTQAYPWVMFDCEREDKSTCPGRLESTIAASPVGGYRYRVFETTVPLRNALWNRGT